MILWRLIYHHNPWSNYTSKFQPRNLLKILWLPYHRFKMSIIQSVKVNLWDYKSSDRKQIANSLMKEWINQKFNQIHNRTVKPPIQWLSKLPYQSPLTNLLKVFQMKNHVKSFWCKTETPLSFQSLLILDFKQNPLTTLRSFPRWLLKVN